MLFTDIDFLYFILPVWFITYLLNKYSFIKLRNIVLLISSYLFYSMFSPTYIISLLFVTIINWFFAQYLQKHKNKIVLSICIILTLLPLLFYKYANFIITEIFSLNNHFFSTIILPIGISFFTFQTLTHTIDTYRQKINEKPCFLEYSLFVSFFPTILAGPIERSRSLLPQIRSKCDINTNNTFNGIQLIIWGLAKKLIVAERIASYIGGIYNHPEMYGGNTVIYAIMLYSIQIYCDFSGYSDIAIGIGRTLGFNLRKNFDFPYFSSSIRQFWRKWHMSLTSWFTEYIYISMGGNRVSQLQWIINVMTVFLISGIWHGAAWTFIIWGAIHGILQIIEHYTLGKKEYDSHIINLGLGIGLFILVSIAFVFFRAETLPQSINILKATLRPWETIFKGSSITSFILMNISVLGLFIGDILLKKRYLKIYEYNDNPFRINELCFMIITFLSVCLLSLSSNNFVYFQF